MCVSAVSTYRVCRWCSGARACVGTSRSRLRASRSERSARTPRSAPASSSGMKLSSADLRAQHTAIIPGPDDDAALLLVVF